MPTTCSEAGTPAPGRRQWNWTPNSTGYSWRSSGAAAEGCCSRTASSSSGPTIDAEQTAAPCGSAPGSAAKTACGPTSTGCLCSGSGARSRPRPPLPAGAGREGWSGGASQRSCLLGQDRVDDVDGRVSGLNVAADDLGAVDREVLPGAGGGDHVTGEGLEAA